MDDIAIITLFTALGDTQISVQLGNRGWETSSVPSAALPRQ
jgi:hypothetical protein